MVVLRKSDFVMEESQSPNLSLENLMQRTSFLPQRVRYILFIVLMVMSLVGYLATPAQAQKDAVKIRTVIALLGEPYRSNVFYQISDTSTQIMLG
jgi:hypothetical protein